MTGVTIEHGGLMQLARIVDPAGGTYLARIEGGAAVPIVAEIDRPGADPLRYALADGIDLASCAAVAEPVALNRTRLLAPVRAPQKIVAIGLNYRDHAA